MSATIRLLNLLGIALKVRARKSTARFQDACRDSEAAQRDVLRGLIALNADSVFSRERRLSADMGVEAFRRALPVRGYDEFAPYIDRMKEGQFQALLGSRNELLMFALSSGTTAESKYIPVTRRFLEDYRRGWQMWGVRAVDDHRGLDRGHILQITSPQNRFLTPAGTPCGNISGLVAAMQHKLVHFLYTLPAGVSQIADAEAKSYTAIRLAAADPIVSWITTANPATLLQLGRTLDKHKEQIVRDIRDGTVSPDFPMSAHERDLLKASFRRKRRRRARQLDRIAERTGRLLPKDVWPKLQMLSVWTGGSAGAYLRTVKELYGEIPIRDHGLHASEGRMTIPLSDSTSGGVLDVTSHFFEFIPEDEIDVESPQTLLPHELAPGENYFILLTTSSGLYRYDIHDVVRCTGFCGTTPLLEFLHKGASISNIAGEKVSESQVVEACRRAAEEFEFALPQFTMAPAWSEPPYYELLVEQSDRFLTDEWDRFALTVDRNLKQLNCEYRDKRQSLRLGPVVLRLIDDGAWSMLAKMRLQGAGSSIEQYKHPCLIPDVEFLERFLSQMQIPFEIGRSRSA